MQLRLRQTCIESRSSGKERDAETGLDFFLARYYSGAQGRFLSVDPENAGAKLKNPQSWNAYAYALNNPLRYVDPDGLDSDDCYVDGVSVHCSAAQTWLNSGAGVEIPNGMPLVYYNYGFQFLTAGAEAIKYLDSLDRMYSYEWKGEYLSETEFYDAHPTCSNGVCEGKILNAVNNKFGTNFSTANITNEFQYSTGAPTGRGTLNLNITGSQSVNVSAGRYPIHWWTYILGFGPTLHIPSTPGGADSPLTLIPTNNQFTAHIDSSYPYGIGFLFHLLIDMGGEDGYQPCP
jgi:RHS repeat-associated protein